VNTSAGVLIQKMATRATWPAAIRAALCLFSRTWNSRRERDSYGAVFPSRWRIGSQLKFLRHLPLCRRHGDVITPCYEHPGRQAKEINRRFTGYNRAVT